MVATVLHAPSSSAVHAADPLVRRTSPLSLPPTPETTPPTTNDYLSLLVQEWLTASRLPLTLQCFVKEHHESGRHLPPEDKWFELTQWLDLPRFLAQVAQARGPHEPPAPGKSLPLLERIVEYVFAERRKATTKLQLQQQGQQPPFVVVSKRPSTASHHHHHSMKFANKRALPVVHSGGSRSTPQLPLPSSPKLRPQSAIVCKSTPDLIRGLDSATTSPVMEDNNSADRAAASAEPGAGHDVPKRTVRIALPEASTTQTQATSSLATSRQPVERPHGGKTNGARSETPVGLTRSQPPLRFSETKRTRRLTALGDSTPQSQTSQSGPTNDRNVMPPSDTAAATAEKPALDVEEATEEQVAEQYAALSKGAMKKLRRVLAKSHAHSQELQRCRKAMEKFQQKAVDLENREVFAAEQTELLSTTMDMLIKEPCSLCRYVFLKRNLTTRVSYKSICDLRASWARRRRRSTSPATSSPEAQPGARRRTLDDDPATLSADDKDDDDPQAAGSLREGQVLDSSQISHLYDEVPVCVFCSQLVLDFSSYRPTSAERRARKEERRRLAAEAQRERELRRQQQRLRCDPLDYHAYELNSDDGDGDDGSEVEEVLEVDDDGRVQVVRRRRHPRRTTRTPAQLGLVSKRLHYDHLRSRSVHALNRKEWELIVEQ